MGVGWGDRGGGGRMGDVSGNGMGGFQAGPHGAGRASRSAAAINETRASAQNQCFAKNISFAFRFRSVSVHGLTGDICKQ